MKKHINIAGIEVRTSTVVIAAVLLLFIAAMLIVRAVRAPAPAPAPTEEPPTAAPTVEPTEEPTPTPVPPSPTPEPTEEPEKEIEVVGEWVGVDDSIGTAYLGVCNGFYTVYTRLYPVPDDLVKAAGEAYPDLPDLQVVAVSNPMYIPNTGTGEVHDDIDATLMTETFPECEKSPWPEEAVQAVLNAKEPLGFFGIARPVTREGEDLWEIVVYAVVWTQ
ncbi:MAG TPA: hypothetical protein EYH30_03485 [Anaerolineales bacterium]|nr:hypothetical protein [Anaerolineales bacterium]